MDHITCPHVDLIISQKREQKLIKPKIKKKKNREEKNRHPEKKEREDCHCS